MEVKINGKAKHFKTVWMEKNIVKIINQLKLPHSFEILSLENYRDTANAIKDMYVRGAGAIGATAGYALAQAALNSTFTEKEDFIEYIEQAYDVLSNTRPTAQNLFYAIDLVFNAIKEAENIKEAKKKAVEAANKIADEDAIACEKIGRHGEKLIPSSFRILTHCNAGWLAFVDWGSALSPIYKAKRKGKNVIVYVDETRPRMQGSRLTAWELSQESIPYKIIADNTAGFLMQKKEIDMVIVGADRIAKNGDVANKIGTYTKAVLAKENKIPFYVAAPTSTFDLECPNGNEIPIEERNKEEILYTNGLSLELNEIKAVRTAPAESDALNIAFDVTPAKYIKGIITEKGIIKRPTEEKIVKFFKK